MTASEAKQMVLAEYPMARLWHSPVIGYVISHRDEDIDYSDGDTSEDAAWISAASSLPAPKPIEPAQVESASVEEEDICPECGSDMKALREFINDKVYGWDCENGWHCEPKEVESGDGTASELCIDEGCPQYPTKHVCVSVSDLEKKLKEETYYKNKWQAPTKALSNCCAKLERLRKSRGVRNE